MKPLLSARRAQLVGCLLGVLAASAGSAQSTSDAPAPAAATPTIPAPKTAPVGPKISPGAPKTGAPSRTAASRSAAASSDSSAQATPPRPRMGLVVPLTQPKTPAASKGSFKPSKYQNTKSTEKAQQYYAGVWGVDKLKASYTNSGNLIKFTYRVRQPKRAAALGDHENSPELIGIRSNAVLHIPTMEKIGQLRQMSAAEADKEYWMVFSNKGNLVRPGDEVSVVIGKFRADGLIVE